MRKPVVGQILWEVYSARLGAKGYEVKVTKVGKKYFSVAPLDIPFLTKEYKIENWQEKTEYTSSYHLYETKQDWLDEVEAETLQTRIQAYFNTYNRKTSLAILRHIDMLLPQGT